MFKNILLLFCIILLFSCVPNKNIVYLQGSPNDENNVEKINKIPYRLRVDDIINIDIKSTDEELVSFFMKSNNQGNGNQNLGNGGQSFAAGVGYFTGYSVDKHGNIRLPYIGEVNVLGYTTTEVRKKLENEIKKYFNNEKEIFLTVKLAGIKYTIIGEIMSPGTKVIMQNNVTIIEAIANSGDISEFGNRRNVEVIRFSEVGKKKYTIDLTQIDAFESEVFNIQPNDLIQIKPLKQKPLGIGTTGLQSLTTVIQVFSLITSVIIISRNL